MMQTVPSLVGTGTAIAAAASGLIFGHPTDSDKPAGRRVLHKRNASLDPSPTRHDHTNTSSAYRPATSHPERPMAMAADDLNHSTLPRPASRSRPPLSRYQRPQSSQFPSRRSSTKNSSLGNDTQVTSGSQTDSRRNSLSSNGSWMRRFSLRPLSQHGSSPRSSMVVDRQSVTLSQSSTVPILRPKTAAANLPPNKLVKRTPSTQNHDSPQVSRSKSKGHLPTLRRPATSHQRTATLEQLRLNAQENQPPPLSGEPKYSFEHRPSTESAGTGSNTTASQTENTHWLSFFHLRRTSLAVDGRPSTGSPHSKANTVRRISTKAIATCQDTVHLVKPSMVSSSSMTSLPRGPPTHLADAAEIVPEQAEQEAHEERKQRRQRDLAAAMQQQATAPTRADGSRDDTTERPSSSMRMKRSLSTSFATVAGHLVSKTSGSIRRSKRGEGQSVSAAASVGRRHASAPISGSAAVPVGVEHHKMGLKPPMGSLRQGPPGPLPRVASASAAFDAPRKPQNYYQQPQQALRPWQHPQRRQSSREQPQQARQPQQQPRQAPYSASPHAVPVATTTATGTVAAPTTFSSTTSSSFHGSHGRNSSPQTPPPQRALNFQIDNSLPRASSSSPAFGPAGGVVAVASAVHSLRPLQPSTSSTTSSAMSTSHHRYPYNETSPQMEGFDSDGRGFISGDDDDTDFKSDTLYDSLRTVASSRARAVETPLESVYDESPPSTASNGKSRRLSIHEMLDKAWDGDDRITEEDETSQTPVRAPPTTKVKPPTRYDARNGHSVEDEHLAANPIRSSFPVRDFGRMSLEDDFDDDWARYEDEADSHISPLSAPSKSSLNAKGMNPNVRLALANMSNGTGDMEQAPSTERPLSNIFDWSEPSTQDKHEAERRSGRPQTAYGKPVDPRGGRSANRRGPAPAHVRSQSVPVVHEAADEHKPAGAKYGTWGLGTKTVSEDWDEDFEFGSAADNDDRENESMFAVPESIRASQPSVKAHSGQIRELSLLVNDLKRLCRHGRDMGLLEGSQKALWKEAEGVIALASPDDETMDDDNESNPSVDLDAFDSKAKQGDQRPKTPQTEQPFYVGSPKLEPSISKTAVLRERHSPRRRSVFSPDDDIFGGAESSADKKASSSPKKPSLHAPQTPERLADVNGVVRTVMEAMQHRTDSDAIPDTGKPSRKVQFDTNSLKALVRRSGELRDALSDIIRRTDQLTQSPARPLRHDRDRGPDSSPAFTRVFDDPGSSPPRRVARSRGNTTLKQTTSPDSSPPPQLERRFPLMTVR
ncbi:hypothetical protein LEL_07897 [Akanthomyces lecanii RCEF 1005]|uniref:Uncharacterized protein n=1 Tax=Akanthomyces lecanii RCEF 1005 TaxID=1081108 RepID=A0A168EWE1_CORDF|nr:hypothetical protein LEL_07897 [Akanthomyces lecanii RCEF 1005]